MHAPLPKATADLAAGHDPLAPTIFHQTWWLDIVTRRTWDAVESASDGVVVGRMPFTRTRTLWFTKSRMPPMTHFLGPGLILGNGSSTARHLRQLQITRDLIQKLPAIESFSQKFHRGVEDVIAFQMEGFQTSVQFSYEIAPAPKDALWRRMRDKTRNAVRNAEKRYAVERGMAPDAFASLYRANLLAKGWDDFIDLDIAGRLIDACRARGCGEALVARDANGAAKAAIFCVWDRSTMYYLVSTRSTDSGNGAVAALVWSAIQDAADKGLVFDFDGLGYAGAILFYAGFGATARPRYIVSKSGPTFRLLREARRIFAHADNAFTQSA